MAYTAVHYPTDKEKDRVPYWPENEELGVAGEHFFDQFLTFDGPDLTAFSGGEFVKDPPSPSIMLDSLNDSATNSSSNDRSAQSGQSQSESATASLDIFSSEALDFELGKPVPTGFTAPLAKDPVLSGGSISDSELLRLEGIDLKSPPKPDRAASSSPPFTNTGPSSPRKHNRVLDSIYATFRRVAHRTKPHRVQDRIEQDAVMTMPEELKTERSTPYGIPTNFDLDDFEDIKVEEALGPVDSRGLPVSPPLTGRIPADHHSQGRIDFVSGHFDDPFCDDPLAPPVVINPAAKSHDPNLNSPTGTPALNDGPFYQHGPDLLDTNGSSFRPPRQQSKLRSTSSAEWPMEGILTNNNNQENMWTSSPPDTGEAHMPDNSSAVPTPAWWDTPQHTNGHHRSRYGQNGNPSNGHDGGLRNSSMSLPMHNRPTDLSIDYGPGDDFSGLMIHMPQPRASQPAVLSSGTTDPLSIPPPNLSYHSLPYAYHPSPDLHQQPGRHRRQYSEQRRPRPRAPSSGSRHYGNGNGPYGTPLTSPRRVSSSACYTLPEESASPTPKPRLRNSSSTSSLAVRKRRSWSRRQGSGSEPRTPGRSASFGPDGARRGSTSSAGGGSSSGGGGGGLSIEFCNYTPNDKKVLMNGVAPSGSSKTKARREREAQENKRKLSEKYMQAIRAAGADVEEKLKQNGFFNEQE